MKTKILLPFATVLFILILTSTSATGQIGTRFPSEKKIVKDPVTGILLTFLTSKPAGDSKIYQTHNQWTADGNWIIFRSNRVKGEAMAVNEKTGIIVQVSEGGYTGMLNVARKSMKLYFMRNSPGEPESSSRSSQAVQVIEVNLAKLFADSEAGKLKAASE
jgi:oligogalacturonide lyase